MACAGAIAKLCAFLEDVRRITFHGKAGEFAARLGVKNAALSLSHTAEQAIAQVILES